MLLRTGNPNEPKNPLLPIFVLDALRYHPKYSVGRLSFWTTSPFLLRRDSSCCRSFLALPELALWLPDRCWLATPSFRAGSWTFAHLEPKLRMGLWRGSRTFFLPQSPGLSTRSLRWWYLGFPAVCEGQSPSCTVPVISVAFCSLWKVSPQYI